MRHPLKHKLKTTPEFFADVLRGAKPFEIRKNDRPFEVGDILRLEEFDSSRRIPDALCVVHSFVKRWCVGPCSCDISPCYTGRIVERVITYRTAFEQKTGYVVLGLAHSAPSSQGWYSMETAPRDSRDVLVFGVGGTYPHARTLVSHYMPGGHCIEDHPPISEGWYFMEGTGFTRIVKPLFWTHLPCLSLP